MRGPGTFVRALAGARRLAAAGLHPVITVSEVDPSVGRAADRAAFLSRLPELGLPRPRLKTLPMFHIGREERRSRPYGGDETLRGRVLTEEESASLQCASGRMVTTKGVYVCPILIDHDEAILGSTLREALRSYPLSHPACFTCHVTGMTCRT